LAEFRKQVQYQLDETCATDGLCSLACPVYIDTGKFVKSWRARNTSAGERRTAEYIANHMAETTAMMRTGLKAIAIFHRLMGTGVMTFLSKSVHFISFGKIPQWMSQMPKGAGKINQK
jgi:D-lactate dehydrogenase